MPNETENKKNKWEVAGIMIPAGLFIGLGVGFVAMAIIHLKVG